MMSRCLAALAGLILVGLAGDAMAQVPMMGNLPSFDSAPAAPPPGAAPAQPMAAPPPGAQRGMAGPANPNDDPCFRDFMALRQEAEKRGSLLKPAHERKAPRTEFCKLFRNLAAAQGKMANFVAENQATCRIPDEAVKNIKAGYEQVMKIRDQACAAGPVGAAPGAPPPGPKLSDELGVGNIARPGTPSRGTFDTLSGSALSR
jgi:hypothetical protein